MSADTNRKNRRQTVKTRSRFTTLLTVYFFVALIIPNCVLANTEPYSVWTVEALILMPLGFYMMWSVALRRSGVMIWLAFPFIFFCAFQIVLLYLFGNSIIATDMFTNLLTTNPGEAGELLGNIYPSVVLVCVIYLPLLWLAAREIGHKRYITRTARMNIGLTGAALFALGLLALWPAYHVSEDRHVLRDEIFPLNVLYNLGLSGSEFRKSFNYEKTSAGFSYEAERTAEVPGREVYVYIIGEASRAMNWQLYGYGRETNPLLSKTDGLSVFRHVLSQSNTTHKSVPMLLAAASAENHARLYREKSLITAFREAGFHTSFISNQQPNHSFIDFFGDEADDFVFIRSAVSVITGDVTAQTSDERLLPYVKNILAKKRKKELIVLHTYGSHFNYRDRYPQSRAKFLPDTPTEAEPKNRPSLINAYDNTILQTDYVLHSIITMLGKSGAQAAMLYTSDHGENIFDDYRKRFLHASPTPASHGIHVPLLVWTSASYRAEYPAVVAALNANREKDVQSSASVFPTMLSIAGISAPCVADVMPLSLTNPAYRCGARRYLNDHNRSVTLKQAGFSDIDFEQLKKWGVGL